MLDELFAYHGTKSKTIQFLRKTARYSSVTVGFISRYRLHLNLPSTDSVAGKRRGRPALVPAEIRDEIKAAARSDLQTCASHKLAATVSTSRRYLIPALTNLAFCLHFCTTSTFIVVQYYVSNSPQENMRASDMSPHTLSCHKSDFRYSCTRPAQRGLFLL